MNEFDEDEPFTPLGQPPGTPVREGDPEKPVDFRAMFEASYEEIEADRRFIEERRQEERAKQAAEALREWEEACPPRIQRYDIRHESLVPYRPHIRRVLLWRHGRQGCLAIGASGKGKTQAIYALAKRIATKDLIPVRYLLQTQVTNEINRSELRVWIEKLDRIRRAPVLVWDDFGKFAAIGSRRDLLASEIEALIDYRFSHDLPMLVSTNLRPADFEEVFGRLRAEPIMRRLLEGSDVVDFDKPTEASPEQLPLK